VTETRHANVTDREVVDRHRTTGVRHDSDDLSKAVRRDGPSNRS
jgi:nicotinic acid phosphoribosyltransferase